MKTELVLSLTDLSRFEARCLEDGDEGVCLRTPNSPYKYGRSTFGEHYLLKLKRRSDAEAIVIGLAEATENLNEPELDQLGLTKRSSALAGKNPKGTLGAFTVRDLVTGVVFSIGSGRGLTAELRQQIWNDPQTYLNRIVKYEYMEWGKERPRHPVWLGFRDERDL